MKTKLLFISACIFLLSFQDTLCQNGFPSCIPEEAGFSSVRLAQMEKQMQKYMEDGQLSGMVTAVMRHGKITHLHASGYADLEEKKPMGKNSIFRIYSMTKPIVTVGLMMLYEEGYFQLDDPLYKYIPEFEHVVVHAGGQKTEPLQQHIKVIDLLRHTSGLGYGWGPGNMVDSLYRTMNRGSLKNNEEFVKKLTKIPLYHQPGTKWRYSVSTDVVGYLVEVLSGQPLDQYLKQRILDPLKMKDTSFEIMDDKDTRFITNYAPGEEEGKLKVIDHPSDSRYTKTVTNFSGGGGLVSTAMDYLRFSQMLLNGGQLDGIRILSPKTIELMTVDHVEGFECGGGPVVYPARGNGFGLGFSVMINLAESQLLGSEGSYGWGGAAGTFFRIDPKEDMIILLMIQLMPYKQLQAREKFQTLVYQAIVE